MKKNIFDLAKNLKWNGEYNKKQFKFYNFI